MVVNNLTDKVFILMEDEAFFSKPYTITKLNSSGCEIPDSQIFGETTEAGEIFIPLLDGKYLLEVEGDMVTHSEAFFVFYNGAPEVIKTIRSILCPCSGCKKVDSKTLQQVFYQVIVYMTVTGLLCSSRITLPELERQGKIHMDAKKYAEYYGEFRFDYDKQIERFLAYFYAELYSKFTNTLNTSQEDLDSVNSMLGIDTMEKCLYKLGYSFNDILCNVQNCGCDE